MRLPVPTLPLPLVLLLSLLVAGPSAARKPKPTVCPAGRFLVMGKQIVTGQAATIDVVVFGSTLSIDSGCGPVTIRPKATRKGTKVKARWGTCVGIRGSARFTGIIEDECRTLRGTFQAKKAKVRASVLAPRSRCGDGVVDPGGNETCESAAACPTGTCGSSCTCGPRDCTGNHAPQATFAVGPTGQTLQPVTFDASTATDADGDPLTYAWSFGDGTRGGTVKISHLYTQADAFAVKLTVGDGCTTTTFERQVTIAAGPPSEGTATASGLVRAVGGGGLAGVLVAVPGGGSGTSGTDGTLTLSVPVGVPFVLTFSKSGYATQLLPLAVPSGSPDAHFETTLLVREPDQPIDAGAGGTVAGKDGATLILPPGALVDTGGLPITGTVQVSLTPVDPVADPDAFPGRYAGVTPDGQEGLLFSYGSVEFDLRQGGAPVNLAPGTAATIDLPLYANLGLGGGDVHAGDAIPLWSLDERSGTWIQEGQGTIMASSATPTGFALRAPVQHLSWWNCDAFTFPPYKPKPKCLVDTNADGILEDLTGTGYCWNAGTGPEQPTSALAPLARAGIQPAAVAAKLPRWAAQATIPAAGGVVLPVPPDVDVTFRASAKNGTLVGQKVVHGPGNLEEEVIIVLEPLDVAAAVPVSIPWDQTYRIDPAGEVDQYRLDADAGALVYVTVSRTTGSSLTGTVFVEGPNGFQLGPKIFPVTGETVAFAAPATGRYRILVDGTAGEPGGYRLQLAATGAVPFLLSTSPAEGAVGVDPSLNAVTATFNQSLAPSSVTAQSFSLSDLVSTTGGAYPLAGTASAVDAVATFAPTAPLAPGITYTARLTTAIRSAAGGSLSQPATWTFGTEDVAGGTARVGRGYNAALAMGPGGEAFLAHGSDSVAAGGLGAVVTRHVPGAGWTAPTVLRTGGGSSINSRPGVATSADGSAIVVFRQTESPGGGIWASRYDPAAGWSPLDELGAPSNALFGGSPPRVGMDAAGGAIAAWVRGAGAVDWRRYVPSTGWTATATLVDVGSTLSEFDLAVATTGRAAFVWVDPNGQAASVRRFDPAAGWGDPEPLSAGGGVIGLHVAIDAAGDVLALWKDGTAFRWRRYTAGDDTWSAPAPLLVDGSPSGTPCARGAVVSTTPAGDGVALGCSTAGFAWAAQFDESTATWSTPDTSFYAGTVCSVALDVNTAGNAVAAWYACPQGQPASAQQVYWRRYTAATGLWDATPTPVPSTTLSGTQPVHVAIAENGQAAVQYNQAPDGNSRVVMVTQLP